VRGHKRSVDVEQNFASGVVELNSELVLVRVGRDARACRGCPAAVASQAFPNSVAGNRGEPERGEDGRWGGVANGDIGTAGYVEQPKPSADVCDAIDGCGGRYLYA